VLICHQGVTGPIRCRSAAAAFARAEFASTWYQKRFLGTDWHHMLIQTGQGDPTKICQDMNAMPWIRLRSSLSRITTSTSECCKQACHVVTSLLAGLLNPSRCSVPLNHTQGLKLLSSRPLSPLLTQPPRSHCPIGQAVSGGSAIGGSIVVLETQLSLTHRSLLRCAHVRDASYIVHCPEIVVGSP
jgi:hypothetical protein